MAISVFPAGGGEFIANDFVVDMNNSDNNVVDLGRSYAAGAYELTLASGDSTFDIYAVDADGASVGYTNNATLVVTDAFTQLAILGVSTTEKITFGFAGASNNATSEGNATGAGAYLESINPTDLPEVDDTANIIGGNFATDVEIYFESGAVSLAAKQVARADSQNLIVTRPDNLTVDLEPWDVRAENPGVPQPTGTNAHILPGTVTAGDVPSWVTAASQTYDFLVLVSITLEATDPDGSVSYSLQAGSLPGGLSLNGTTGEISGTATTTEGDVDIFTVRATDESSNFTDREFTFTAQASKIQSLVIAGGGGGGDGGGGGGAGGYRSSVTGESSGGGASAETGLQFGTDISIGTTYSVTVGAGGAASTKGSDSVFATITSEGGGFGGVFNDVGGDGGSGGGGGGSNGSSVVGGSGTANQGFDGGDGNTGGGGTRPSGGGGGASEVGESLPTGFQSGDGGDGVASSITGTSVVRAGGGGGGGDRDAADALPGVGGAGGGGDGARYQATNATAGATNTGGGGGGGGPSSDPSGGMPGGSGVVILRYPSAYSITIGAGLTGTETTDGDEKVAEITAGAGNVSWAA